jgi:hypothetical protein
MCRRSAAADRAGPGGFAELAEDRGHVVADGLLREEQPLRDLRVGQAASQQVQDLDLAVRRAAS